jgi:tRNA-Thr(GGU) m(6)t(6)A37 methyltransferase TsaA
MSLEDIIKIQPIGVVNNTFEDEVPKDYMDQLSDIVINTELIEGLHRIEDNSHIVVVFWMDRIGKNARRTMRLHPRRREDLPLTGVFATRSPRRPNPIGIRAVRLIEVKNNILKVEGLDALNQTPVLDIKPYFGRHDSVRHARGPPWARHHQPEGERIYEREMDG